jgi:cyclomaltodextrin glucanotransferase
MNALLIFFIIFTTFGVSPGLSAKDGEIGNETIYSLIVDRFNDGDTSNNIPEYAYSGDTKYDIWNRKMLGIIYDAEKKSWNKYWGGDLKGLHKKLGYLKDLGITAIMISPVFENANGYLTIKGTEPRITAYHGYWLKDLFRLNEHFVSRGQGEEQLKELIDEAHEMGLKMILDININHTSPAKDGLKNTAEVQEYELQDGAIFEDGKFIAARTKYFEDTFKIKNKEQGWFHKYPEIVWNADVRKKLSLKGNSPSQFEEQNWMLHGLADLDHENKNVRDYIIRALVKWTKMGVDGYRVDAAKHIPASLLIDIKKQLRKHNPDLIFIAEWPEAGIRDATAMSFSERTGTTLFDFAKMKAVRKLYLNKGGDYSYIKGIMESPYDLITLFESHDSPRVLSVKDIPLDRYDEMLKFLFAASRIPFLYYGAEQYLHNDSYRYGRASFGQIGGDPWNRDYMDWGRKDYDKIRAYTIIKTLSGLRLKNTALRYGSFKMHGTDDSILAFERIHKDHIVLYVSSTKKGAITIKTSLPDGKYIDPVEHREYEVKGHELKVALEPLRAVILGSI